MSRTYKNKDTACVHAGSIPDPNFGGVNSPIFTSSAYEFLERDSSQYPRYFNTPNQLAVVEKLCALEEGDSGMVLSSGMAAISTVFACLLRPGDHVVLQDPIYGGTHYFAQTQFAQLGVTHTMVLSEKVEDFEAAIQENTKVLYFETPANPLLNILDIAGMAELARDKSITSVIDNTFASPINQNPLTMGVDVVIHSGTKYLGGHSDLCFGAVITHKEIRDAMQKIAVNWGGSLDAFTCYQIERSLKTLALRVERQNQNALQVAQALSKSTAIDAVYYPGLESHPGHQLAKNQMKGFGGMLSFNLKDTSITGQDYCQKLKLIKTAVSLGGIETTVTIPSLTSHAKMTASERENAGISEHLMRLSVGIEDPWDLIADLLQAVD